MGISSNTMWQKTPTNLKTKFEFYNKLKEDKDLQKDKRLLAGQSKRIWEELYKVFIYA